MPLGGFGLAFVEESVVIDAVGEVLTSEWVGADEDLAVFGVGVVVFDMEYHFAVAVADAQFVGAVTIRIFEIDVCVQVTDSPHVVDAVSVRSDDVREDQVVFDDYDVADGVAAPRIRDQGQSDDIVAPRGIDVRRVQLVLGCLAVTKVPGNLVGGVVQHVVGKEGGEGNFTVGFAHHAAFWCGSKVDGRLWRSDDVIPLGKGILAPFFGGSHQLDGVGAGRFKVEGRGVVR